LRFEKLYNKYKDYLLFNKNILISGIFAFFAGAIFTQIYSELNSNNLSNSIVTLTIEYCVYIPIFSYLFYLDNRSRYIQADTGKKNYEKIKTDIKKLITAFAISEVIFSVSKLLLHYQLLMLDFIVPYQTSMIASIIAWIIFLLVINLSIKAVHLFKSK
jgi:cytochrome bd-type quinol oxidase subunit 2